jgi:hypothetical protein
LGYFERVQKIRRSSDCLRDVWIDIATIEKCSVASLLIHVLVSQVLEDPTDDGIKSTLIIRNSRYEQFGVYNCTASNDYGSDSIEITLVPRSK